MTTTVYDISPLSRYQVVARDLLECATCHETLLIDSDPYTALPTLAELVDAARDHERKHRPSAEETTP